MYHGARLLRFVLPIAFATQLVACAAAPATERAMTLARQHRESDAIKLLKDDLAQHPDDIAARRLLVRLLAYSGNLTAARLEIDELARRMPKGDPTPWLELGHALELAHRFDEALAAYDQAAEVAPQSPAGPREGGMRCARWGEIQEARPRLEEAIRRGAHDGETFHTLGLVLVHLKDLDAAEQAYRRGAAADPHGAENWLGLATVALVRGDPAKALAAYDQIVARKPAYAPAELGRAWALAKLGRKDDARKALDRAEELGAPASSIAKQRAALNAAP
jgi:tetratricopeptide (TPR) repeat protein